MGKIFGKKKFECKYYSHLAYFSTDIHDFSLFDPIFLNFPILYLIKLFQDNISVKCTYVHTNSLPFLEHSPGAALSSQRPCAINRLLTRHRRKSRNISNALVRPKHRVKVTNTLICVDGSECVNDVIWLAVVNKGEYTLTAELSVSLEEEGVTTWLEPSRRRYVSAARRARTPGPAPPFWRISSSTIDWKHKIIYTVKTTILHKST